VSKTSVAELGEQVLFKDTEGNVMAMFRYYSL
jgi:hypothetical protein